MIEKRKFGLGGLKAVVKTVVLLAAASATGTMLPVPSRAEVEPGASLFPPHQYFFNHVHTNRSLDNKDLKAAKLSPRSTFEQVDAFLKLRGESGFLALTDHNDDRSFDEIQPLMRPGSRVQALRSAEWGLPTHMGLIGLGPNWPLLAEYRQYKGIQMIEASRGAAELRIVNHPDYESREWAPAEWGDADAVEVWNGPFDQRPFYLKKSLSKGHNDLALKQWAETLAEGRRYTAVAGSDWHFDVPCLMDRYLFYPANVVFAASARPDDVVAAVRSGHLSVLTKPEAPKLHLTAGWEGAGLRVAMGDALPGSGALVVELQADYSDIRVPMRQSCYPLVAGRADAIHPAKDERMVAELFQASRGTEPVARAELAGNAQPQSIAFKLEVTGSRKDSVRVELWRENPATGFRELQGLTNPVYLNY
jgi:hypothetical protein